MSWPVRSLVTSVALLTGTLAPAAKAEAAGATWAAATDAAPAIGIAFSSRTTAQGDKGRSISVCFGPQDQTPDNEIATVPMRPEARLRWLHPDYVKTAPFATIGAEMATRRTARDAIGRVW